MFGALSIGMSMNDYKLKERTDTASYLAVTTE